MPAVPRLDEQDVRRLVAREFPDDARRAASILGRYGELLEQIAAPRVHAAALFLAGGNLDELERWVNVARQDFRDVLMNAEYPNHDEGPEHRESDARAYTEWLERTD